MQIKRIEKPNQRIQFVQRDTNTNENCLISLLSYYRCIHASGFISLQKKKSEYLSSICRVNVICVACLLTLWYVCIELLTAVNSTLINIYSQKYINIIDDWNGFLSAKMTSIGFKKFKISKKGFERWLRSSIRISYVFI